MATSPEDSEAREYTLTAKQVRLAIIIFITIAGGSDVVGLIAPVRHDPFTGTEGAALAERIADNEIRISTIHERDNALRQDIDEIKVYIDALQGQFRRDTERKMEDVKSIQRLETEVEELRRRWQYYRHPEYR